jgi:exopolyphosphatase/guanosine-5'-triphosphate,3'-diphosphate pyrophosphatase
LQATENSKRACGVRGLFARRAKVGTVKGPEDGAAAPESAAFGAEAVAASEAPGGMAQKRPPVKDGPPARREKAAPPAQAEGGSSRETETGGAAGAEGPARSRRRKRRRRYRRSAYVKDHRPDGGAKSQAAARSAPAEPDRPAPSGSFSPLLPPKRAIPAYAALDLGTNNCRLLIAVPTRPGHFRVVDAFSRIVRLGEGVAASGRLRPEAMERALSALKVCAEKLAQRPVVQARLIATEACRSAENGAEFLDRVRAETGLSLEIIDRQTEARLAVSGCGSLVEEETQGVVLFDIGGGSSEIALVDLSNGHRSRRLARHIVAWTSLPVGVVSLAERFGGRNVSARTFAAMVEEVTGLLEAFAERDRLRHLEGNRFHLLGTSGTVTTLAGVHLDLRRYDRRKVDGLWMTASEVDRMTAKLLGWSFEERKANPCIGAERADLVLAGCAILQAIRRMWPTERLRVADRGLREGILSEMMAESGAWRRNRRGGRQLPERAS